MSEVGSLKCKESGPGNHDFRILIAFTLPIDDGNDFYESEAEFPTPALKAEFLP